MRVALVSPYSWSYLGGVNAHIQALAGELRRLGDDVRILAPFDPPDAATKLAHGSEPARATPPDVALGRTVSLAANGARSNLCFSAAAVRRLRAEIGGGRFDVVHVHEPVAPLLGPAAVLAAGSTVVATFHAYSTSVLPNLFARSLGARRVFAHIDERIAVSAAAEWTGRRWFGGRYRVIPNGVDLTRAPTTTPVRRGPCPALLFVGRAEPRKGLPVLLSAFDALAQHTPATLTVVGARPEEVLPLVEPETARRVSVLGRVGEEELWRHLHEADVLCAPSLWGESFGMILIEAFAAGTPVVASAIAGYSDVVDDGRNGILVAPGEPRQLGEALRTLAGSPELVRRMSGAARRSAERYAWPRVAGEVREVYEGARRRSLALGGMRARAHRRPSPGGSSPGPRRLPSLDPPVARRAARLRRAGSAASLVLAVLVAALLVVYAAGELTPRATAAQIAGAKPGWLAIAAGAMAGALVLRSVCWRSLVRAALPGRAVRFADIAFATMIGVLVSAVLPGRLGEPTRALVVSRRVGRVRRSFPTLLGTIVVQSGINAAALFALGVIVASTSDLMTRHPYVLPALLLVPVLTIGSLELVPRLAHRRAVGGKRMIGRVVTLLNRARAGLAAFRVPAAMSTATGSQLAAWGGQVFACYAVSRALSLQGSVGFGAAAAVLFGVNVAAAVPLTPSNVGVFQLAVVIVLSTGYGVSTPDAVAYGLVLQAVEFITAVALGVPSLLLEGLRWRDLRFEAFRAVELAPA